MFLSLWFSECGTQMFAIDYYSIEKNIPSGNLMIFSPFISFDDIISFHGIFSFISFDEIFSFISFNDIFSFISFNIVFLSFHLMISLYKIDVYLQGFPQPPNWAFMAPIFKTLRHSILHVATPRAVYVNIRSTNRPFFGIEGQFRGVKWTHWSNKLRGPMPWYVRFNAFALPASSSLICVLLKTFTPQILEFWVSSQFE